MILILRGESLRGKWLLFNYEEGSNSLNLFELFICVFCVYKVNIINNM